MELVSSVVNPWSASLPTWIAMVVVKEVALQATDQCRDLGFTRRIQGLSIGGFGPLKLTARGLDPDTHRAEGYQNIARKHANMTSLFHCCLFGHAVTLLECAVGFFCKRHA